MISDSQVFDKTKKCNREDLEILQEISIETFNGETCCEENLATLDII